jgi:hypothetical protein
MRLSLRVTLIVLALVALTAGVVHAFPAPKDRRICFVPGISDDGSHGSIALPRGVHRAGEHCVPDDEWGRPS